MALTVSDEAIFETQRQVGEAEGIFVCPEGAACVAALKDLKSQKELKTKDQVVIFNTATGLKYSDFISADVPKMDPLPEVAIRKGAR